MKNKTGLEIERWRKEYEIIKNFAIANKMRNLIIALELAVQYHKGQDRDSGEPYIIHPLLTCKTLILLNIGQALKKWYPNKSSAWIKHQCDIIYAAAILHDVIEDCNLPNQGREMVEEYHLDEEVWHVVKLLSKPPKGEPYNPDEYFGQILMDWKAFIIKLSDRANNCATMQVFNEQKRQKYILKTSRYVFSLCIEGKVLYPYLSNIITILESLIVSICESLASISGMKEIIRKHTQDYEKMLGFIEQNAINNKMLNTYEALIISKDIYDGQFRTSGDPFIIHPLRVTSYLMSLGIMDDVTNAMALLHERARWKSKGEEIVKNSNIDYEVIKLVEVVANKNIPLIEYYDKISQNPKTILEKLANRAHTCTFLANATLEEMEKYIYENQNFMVPMCEFAIKNYPQYANQIEIMLYHILSISNIVESVAKEKNNRLTSQES